MSAPGFQHVAQEIHIPVEMGGKDKIPAEFRRQLRAFNACAEQEFFRGRRGQWRGFDAVVLHVS
ncbi:hypothetical protein D3C76_1794460 [compost metagenome]